MYLSSAVTPSQSNASDLMCHVVYRNIHGSVTHHEMVAATMIEVVQLNRTTVWSYMNPVKSYATYVWVVFVQVLHMHITYFTHH